MISVRRLTLHRSLICLYSSSWVRPRLSAVGAQFVAADRAALSSPAYCLARGNRPSHIDLGQRMCGPGRGCKRSAAQCVDQGGSVVVIAADGGGGPAPSPGGGGRGGSAAIAVKVSAVSDPCPAAVKVGFGFTWAEPRRHSTGRNRREAASLKSQQNPANLDRNPT
jgi:hypothetical protein